MSVEQFRITTWPEVVIEVPPIMLIPFDLRGERLIFDYKSPREFVDLPDELAIRDLLALDCHNQTAVLDFMRRHGVITEKAGPAIVFDVVEPKKAIGSYWGHAAAYLHQAQLLSRHLLAHLDETDVSVPWREAELDFDLPSAWMQFEKSLNAGLGAYSARVSVEISYPTGSRWSAAEPPLELYSGLCLQLRNMLAEALPARRCANERCGQAFIRQQGRAQAGQYRTIGVDYCSTRCAKAQMQRNYRRRQLEKARKA